MNQINIYVTIHIRDKHAKTGTKAWIDVKKPKSRMLMSELLAGWLVTSMSKPLD